MARVGGADLVLGMRMHPLLALGALPMLSVPGGATMPDAAAISRLEPDLPGFWACMYRPKSEISGDRTVVFSSTRSTNQ